MSGKFSKKVNYFSIENYFSKNQPTTSSYWAEQQCINLPSELALTEGLRASLEYWDDRQDPARDPPRDPRWMTVLIFLTKILVTRRDWRRPTGVHHSPRPARFSLLAEQRELAGSDRQRRSDVCVMSEGARVGWCPEPLKYREQGLVTGKDDVEYEIKMRYGRPHYLYSQCFREILWEQSYPHHLI